MDESDLFESTKTSFEQRLQREQLQPVKWFEEPRIVRKEREKERAPASVHEEPDLLCISQSGNDLPICSVIEVKDKLNKKAIGQAITYQWALKNHVRILNNGSDVNFPSKFVPHTAIASRYLKNGYQEVIEGINTDMLKKRHNIDLIPISDR